ncbi:hypothetical protein [Aeropyrum camini]|nr:hypothetical protein [Aeropyrum camini]
MLSSRESNPPIACGRVVTSLLDAEDLSKSPSPYYTNSDPVVAV